MCGTNVTGCSCATTRASATLTALRPRSSSELRAIRFEASLLGDVNEQCPGRNDLLPGHASDNLAPVCVRPPADTRRQSDPALVQWPIGHCGENEIRQSTRPPWQSHGSRDADRGESARIWASTRIDGSADTSFDEMTDIVGKAQADLEPPIAQIQTSEEMATQNGVDRLSKLQRNPPAAGRRAARRKNSARQASQAPRVQPAFPRLRRDLFGRLENEPDHATPTP